MLLGLAVFNLEQSHLIQPLIIPSRVDAFEIPGQPVVLANKQKVQCAQGRLPVYTQVTFNTNC